MTVSPHDRPAEGEYVQKVSVTPSALLKFLMRLRRGLLWRIADKAAGIQVVSKFAAAADDFKPDVVVGVMLPDIYLTAAAHYAGKHDIPLVIFCHDDYEQYLPLGARGYFANIYRRASVRLCVSEVMEREYTRRYGVAGLVLHPIPGTAKKETRQQRDGDVLTVGYAGSVGQGYESAMLALADALAAQGGRLVIASPTLRTVAARIWYHPAVTDLGPLAPEQVERGLADRGVNVLAVVQSFDPGETQIKYNFPSKLTEYMMYGLPILVVAPEYASTPLWLAEEPSAAILVTIPESGAFREPLMRLAQAGERFALARATGEVAQRFVAQQLSDLFERSLRQAIEATPTAS